MSWDKSSTDTLHPILFRAPELRQILAAYSEGVLKKGWKDYGFQSSPQETRFVVLERGGGEQNTVICSLARSKSPKNKKSDMYCVYDGERPVLKTPSFLEALNHFKTLGQSSGKKSKKSSLKVVS